MVIMGDTVAGVYGSTHTALIGLATALYDLDGSTAAKLTKEFTQQLERAGEEAERRSNVACDMWQVLHMKH